MTLVEIPKTVLEAAWESGLQKSRTPCMVDAEATSIDSEIKGLGPSGRFAVV
jgi:hypothetical protein